MKTQRPWYTRLFRLRPAQPGPADLFRNLEKLGCKGPMISINWKDAATQNDIASTLDAMQRDRNTPPNVRDCAQRLRKMLFEHPATALVLERLHSAKCAKCDARC